MQIGELSGGLSENYRKATSNRVQWGPMKGMRNMVAHSYGNMNREIIWETASVDIPALKGFCLEQLADQDGSGIRINDNYCISVTKLSQNSVQRNDYRKSIKHRSVFPPIRISIALWRLDMNQKALLNGMEYTILDLLPSLDYSDRMVPVPECIRSEIHMF